MMKRPEEYMSQDEGEVVDKKFLCMVSRKASGEREIYVYRT
jgi:hypothetical protein